MESDYHVRTDVFEGPFEMLLIMVEKRKLFINDIALSKVADDYIGYVRELEGLPVGQTAHFVMVASTLVLIKSRSLLPQIELSYEEEQSIEELQERLRLYKRFTELSQHIRARFGKHVMYPRTERRAPDHAPVFAPDRKTTVANLHAAVHDVIGKIPKKEKVPQAVVRKVISLEETIDKLIERVTNGVALSFREFSGGHHSKEERVTVIVSFLAMLELVKRGALLVKQDEMFSDIAMENQAVSVPHY